MPELFHLRCHLIALCAALPLACAGGARARVEGQAPRAEKLSEYVNEITSCHAGAHLDNLAIQLQNDPTATGYIAVFGPGDKYGERAVQVTKDYLVNARSIEESRLGVVYARPD